MLNIWTIAKLPVSWLYSYLSLHTECSSLNTHIQIYPKSVILCKGRNIEWPWNREFGFYDLHQNRKVWHPHHCWRCPNLCQFLTPLTCEQEDAWNPPLRAVTYPLPRVGVPPFFSTSFHQPEHRKVVMDGSTITMTQNMLTMQKVATGTLRPWNSSCCNRVFGSFSSTDLDLLLFTILPQERSGYPRKTSKRRLSQPCFCPHCYLCWSNITSRKVRKLLLKWAVFPFCGNSFFQIRYWKWMGAFKH